MRSSVEAIRNEPTSRHPGDRPVSCASDSSRRYTSTLCIIIRVNGKLERSWPTRPAEWNVLPLVGSARSITSTSVHPRSARCHAMLAPATPAPTITISALGCTRLPLLMGRLHAPLPSGRCAVVSLVRCGRVGEQLTVIGTRSVAQQAIEVEVDVPRVVDVEHADALLHKSPHRLAEVTDHLHEREPSRAARRDCAEVPDEHRFL